jgi:hypothetical protein
MHGRLRAHTHTARARVSTKPAHIHALLFLSHRSHSFLCAPVELDGVLDGLARRLGHVLPVLVHAHAHLHEQHAAHAGRRRRLLRARARIQPRGHVSSGSKE